MEISGQPRRSNPEPEGYLLALQCHRLPQPHQQVHTFLSTLHATRQQGFEVCSFCCYRRSLLCYRLLPVMCSTNSIHDHAVCCAQQASTVCLCVTGKLLQQLTQSFTDHSSSDCRRQHFEILRSAWQLRPAMHAALRPALLSTLGDADPTLRAQALEFWDSALPKHVGLRLQALLQDSLTDAGLLVCTASLPAM